VFARRDTRVLLEKRPPSGLWGGLWGVPEFPTRAHALQWCQECLVAASAGHAGDTLHHAFSHFDYEMKPIFVTCVDAKPRALHDDGRYLWYDTAAPAAVGLPKPIATLLQRAVRGGE
jgi:A/G-specific adenine glycosylase